MALSNFTNGLVDKDQSAVNDEFVPNKTTEIVFWTALNPLVDDIFQTHPISMECLLNIMVISSSDSACCVTSLGMNSPKRFVLWSKIDFSPSTMGSRTSINATINTLGVNVLRMSIPATGVCLSMSCSNQQFSPRLACGGVAAPDNNEYNYKGDEYFIEVSPPLYLTPLWSRNFDHTSSPVFNASSNKGLVLGFMIFFILLEGWIAMWCRRCMDKRQRRRKLFAESQGEWLLGTTVRQRLGSQGESVFVEVECQPTQDAPRVLPVDWDADKLLRFVQSVRFDVD
jgi:hypothetical protein